MAGFTNKGKAAIMDGYFRATGIPTSFYVALCTADSTPDADTNTMADLTEIAAGNGYTSGGESVDRNTTDFDTLTENDTDDRGDLQIKDITWTASGGSIPASGGGARWAVLTDDDGVVANREVYAYWDLSSARSVTDGQDLSLQDLELRLQET